MNNIDYILSQAGSNVLNLDNSKFSAVMQTVTDTTDVFDDNRNIASIPVPGQNEMSYIPFGYDDQLPYDIIRLIGADEVTAQNKLFNVQTCYGAGIRFKDLETNQQTHDPEIKKWINRQFLPSYFLEQITDMKYFYFSVAVIILSRDQKKITRLVHKEACYCRLEKADKMGRINHVICGDFRNYIPTADNIEVIPLLDLRDPLGDLMQRMGQEPLPNGKIMKQSTACKFAILLRYPTPGCQYYPIPYYTSIFRGGSYDEKRLISTGKRAKLRNTTSTKYIVNIYRGYWTRIFEEERITDAKKQIERVNTEKAKIQKFLTGIENAGKAWITGYYVDPDGHQVQDIIINNIEGQKEGGDWNEDVSAAANTICYADNVHPNLVGAVPGKTQSNNSGSDKRELFTMKQALEISWHDMLLQPLRIVCAYNGWNVEPCVDMIQLTTLDQHKDSKTTHLDEEENDDNN